MLQRLWDWLVRQVAGRPSSENAGRPSSENELYYYRVQVSFWTAVFLVGGLLIVLLYGTAGSRGIGLIWALGCFGVGGGLGFLFGIPKTVQRGTSPPPKPPAPGQPPSPAPAGEADGYRQYVNTNLEDISDWLTKIIVGLTLVQFRDLAGYFRDCAALFAAGLGPGDDVRNLAFAEGAIVYFTVLGFLCGYLMTRLFLAVALRLADQEELHRLKAKVAQMEATVQAQAERTAPDGEAQRPARTADGG